MARCIFEWPLEKWPYTRRCGNDTIYDRETYVEKVVCAEHDKCFCCGVKPTQGNGEYVQIPEFCVECNDNRCDAYPGTCPNRESKRNV